MSSRLSRIRNKLQRVLRTVRKPEPKVTPAFTGEMTIEEAWTAHPGAPSVFAQYHLPGCDGCAVRFEERIEEAAEAYGIELDQFLSDLNRLRQ